MKRTFLIVEDNPAMRRLIRRVLGNLAGDVFECEDGSQAPRAYLDHHPDWVLMDVEMKTMDGLVATAQIKNADPEARIVIVTNFDDSKLRDAASQAGACAYVLKDDLLSLHKVIRAESLRRKKA